MIIAAVIVIALLLTLKNEGQQARDMEKVLPIWKIENDCIISKQGDITVAFRVQLPEIFTLAADDYEALHQAWIKAIKVLPKYSVFHKQDWFLQEHYEADFTRETDFLSQASERFFNERPYIAHECFIFLTKKPQLRKPASSVFSNLLRPRMTPIETSDPQLVNEFLNAVGQFEKIMADSGYVQLTRLKNEDLGGSAEKTGLIERYCFLLGASQPATLQDIEFKPEWKIGDKHLQMYTLADCEHLPALCGPRITHDRLSTERTKFSVSFAAPLGQLLGVNHLYNQFIVIDDAAKTLKRLESKRRRLQSLSTYSRENAIARDAANGFLNEAISQGRLPVKGHFNVMLWTTDREQLKQIRNRASAAIAQMDATPHEETKGAPQLYWAALPGNQGELPANECFDSFAEQATCFLHMESNKESSLAPEGIRLGDRLTGKPMYIDLFDEPMRKALITNRSLMLIGPSGSGKSFFTNHLCRSYHAQGAHILIVDVGHSYQGLCSLVGGYYFTYREEDPIRFNPFYLQEGDYMDTETRESLKTLLLALWKKDSETYKRSEYVALSNAITLYYEHLEANPDIFPCFDSFYEFLNNVFIEVLRKDNVKEKDFDIDNFLYVLRPFFRGGEFDYLLNARQNLDLLHQRFIVFELDNVKDHPVLFPVITLVVMQTFINKMRKIKGVKKMILIEEAWKALMREGFAEYIKYLYKTVRKFYGIAAVVTQDIEDIISSPVVKQAIVNNADIKILLDQSKYQNKFSFIQELLGISDKGKMLILSINKDKEQGRLYKDVFIDLGGTWMRVYRVEVSQEEYYTYTTEEREKVLVQQYAKKYGSYEKGIKMLVQDLRDQKKAGSG